MKLYSTNNPKHIISLKEAVIQGLSPDGGLFMPTEIPKLQPEFFDTIEKLSFQEIALTVSSALLKEDIPAEDLKKIVYEAVNFDAPLVKVSENNYALELFHGPTCAFKDFGGRFMSRLVRYFNSREKITILAATSGDTGSAVAHGFLNIPGTEVILLYPKEKVSHIQEQQLTTMGGNITALEIAGTFDDCQAIVKQAFNDQDLKAKYRLTSANSINIARLIPQSFYYFYAYAQIKEHGAPIFSVPSGNFGNLTAGLFAAEMGLPVRKFIAATNANDTFPKYLHTGKLEPKPSVQTISNAMDVGNPSNAARIIALFPELETLRQKIWSKSFSDKQTTETIQKIQEKYHYLLDPHGAVAWLGLEQYRQESGDKSPGIFLETAHPAKFGAKVEIPPQIAQYLDRKKEAIPLNKDYQIFKNWMNHR